MALHLFASFQGYACNFHLPHLEVGCSVRIVGGELAAWGLSSAGDNNFTSEPVMDLVTWRYVKGMY